MKKDNIITHTIWPLQFQFLLKEIKGYLELNNALKENQNIKIRYKKNPMKKKISDF